MKNENSLRNDGPTSLEHNDAMWCTILISVKGCLDDWIIDMGINDTLLLQSEM